MVKKKMSIAKSAKYILLIVAIALIGTGIWGYTRFVYIFTPIVIKSGELRIQQGMDLSMIRDTLVSNGLIPDGKAFDWVANKKKYGSKIKMGNFRIEEGTTTNNLINKLISNNQAPIDITFNNVRTVEQLTSVIAGQIMADSVAVYNAFMSDSAPEKCGFTVETFPAMFVPNTYEIYWTVPPQELLGRFKQEYSKFWSGSRARKAEKLGLTPVEVVTLASIVHQETNVAAEMPTVAGVYLNRLKKRWPLQADPTVKFALGDFAKKRILTVDLEVDSPYNTYKNIGLPPGPICIPDIVTVDAVLNAKVHKYMYFCAKSDFSGSHVFARTLSEHNRNAAKYHRALNRAKIR